MATRGNTVKIRRFIVDNLASHPKDIAAVASKRFSISRQAVHSHLRDMEKAGTIESDGRTRGKEYRLCALEQFSNCMDVAGLYEDVPWNEHIRPKLDGVKQNVVDICAFGFTEMLNNVIDHSSSDKVHLRLLRTHDAIDLQINDFGVGIFRKIKDAFGLPDELEAIKQLIKGKLTTDPAHHTGEGIFFTSRLFDCFSVLSGELWFSHVRQENDWLIENKQTAVQGTHIRMTISANSTLRHKDVFDQFTSNDGDFTFSKTIVPVRLIQYGTDNLVSRSQAKRLLSRVDSFKNVYLDFSEVQSIGQAFADEIFRVFERGHPEVLLMALNACPDIEKMINRARGVAPLEGQKELF